MPTTIEFLVVEAVSVPDVVRHHGVTTLSGITNPSTVLTVFDNNKPIGTTTTGIDGTWSFDTKVTGNGIQNFSIGFPSDTFYSQGSHQHLQGGPGFIDWLIVGRTTRSRGAQISIFSASTTQVLGR